MSICNYTSGWTKVTRSSPRLHSGASFVPHLHTVTSLECKNTTKFDITIIQMTDPFTSQHHHNVM